MSCSRVIPLTLCLQQLSRVALCSRADPFALHRRRMFALLRLHRSHFPTLSGANTGEFHGMMATWKISSASSHCHLAPSTMVPRPLWVQNPELLLERPRRPKAGHCFSNCEPMVIMRDMSSGSGCPSVMNAKEGLFGSKELPLCCCPALLGLMRA